MSFADYYQNKKVLITGNTGFKGAWLTAWLLKMGAQVSGFSIDVPTDPSMFEACEFEKKIQHKFGDINKLEEIKAFVAEIRPDIIFHMAAQPLVRASYNDPSETIFTNAIGTVNILEAVRLLDLPASLIMITSDKAYDNVEQVWGYKETDAIGGKDPYSASKGMAELAIKTYFHSFFKTGPVKLAIGRAGNVIGGGDWAADRIVPDAIRSWNQKQPLEVRSPDATRPWQHVLEPLSGYLNLGAALHEKKDMNGEAFNFGPLSEQEVSVAQLLTEMVGHWQGAEYKSVKSDNNKPEAGLLKLNCDKALNRLKWVPALSLEKNVELTMNWYVNYYQRKGDISELTDSQIDIYEEAARKKNISWAIA